MRNRIESALRLDQKLKFSEVIRAVILYGIPLLVLIFFIILGLLAEGTQQFSLLSQSFLKGHLYFSQSIGGVGQDPVIYKGHQYWDEGPFPAIFLLPFVWLFNISHHLFYQGYIKWALVFAIIYIIYKLSRQFNYSKADSLFMVIAFTLGSVFIGSNSVSSGWLFAQILNTLLLFMFIYEFFNKKRFFYLGILGSFIFLTRMSASPILIIPAIDIVLKNKSISEKIKKLAILGIPVLIGIVLFFSYNYLRFGSILQNGNKYQLISTYSADARSMGILSIKHIPTNLYTMILRGPSEVLRNNIGWSLKFPYIQNNILGMSIFITSPYLLYFFLLNIKKYSYETKLLLVASFISALLVLMYYGDGANQMGYRYSLDFLPELFVAFMLVYKKNNTRVTFGMKSLVLLTVLINTYFTYGFLANSA